MAKSTSKYLNSNRKSGIKHRALAHGPAKHGKTFSALQASKKFPKKLPASKWTKLDDLLWVAFDDGALDGALETKLEVPSIDFYSILEDEGDLIDALNILGELCHEAADKNPSLIIVPDTVTKLDKMINMYWNDEANAPKGKGGSIDGYAVYRCIQEQHARFHDDMMALACHVIFLAHSKPMGESTSVKAKAKAGALPAEGPTDTIMDFNYYASGNIYRQDTSIIATIHSEKDGRWAYTATHQGSEGGCRWQHSLDPKEEANFGKMFAKIDAQLK